MYAGFFMVIRFQFSFLVCVTVFYHQKILLKSTKSGLRVKKSANWISRLERVDGGTHRTSDVTSFHKTTRNEHVSVSFAV